VKQISLELSLILACLIAVVACDSGKPAGTTTLAGADTALMSPASSPGRADNDEGVGHYKQGIRGNLPERRRQVVLTRPSCLPPVHLVGPTMTRV